MAQLNINIGTQPNDGTGDDLRSAMQKVNTNFTELYGASTISSQITIAGNEINSNQTNANLKLTASGTGVIEFEGIEIGDNRIQGTRSNENLILSTAGSGSVNIEGGLTVSGGDTTTADLVVGGNLSANFISSDDSSAVTIGDSLNITGVLSANTIDVNAISSNDSSEIQINDSVNITGTLTAGTITGVTALTRGQVSDGTATTSSSTIANLDTFAKATFRSATYEVSVSDTTNTRFALHTLRVTHDGTNAFIDDTSVSSTGSAMATFSADISGTDVRVRVVPISSDSTTYKFLRTAIND